VGQYSLHFARQRAQAGENVVLAGFSSTEDSVEQQAVGEGSLTVLRFKVATYDRSRFVRRMLWTLKTNLRLLWKTRGHLRTVDEILFTGSPPFLLHFLAPLNFLLRKKLVYRITDFHPECLMASMEQRILSSPGEKLAEGEQRNTVPLSIRLLYRLTIAWRKTVDQFEILGEDQRRRLMEIGIPTERIKLKRDLSPVRIEPDTLPLERPQELAGRAILLYSGNFGVAHDHETFLEAYKLHHLQGSGRVGLWLNAIGAKADLVEAAIRREHLPIHRSQPVPLQQLSRLLITPDAHLITLRDHFVGFVLPSKVYGCIESGRDVLYIGSDESDIHLLCKEAFAEDRENAVSPLATRHSPLYSHAPVGDIDSVVMALEEIADRAESGTSLSSQRTHQSVAGFEPFGSVTR